MTAKHKSYNKCARLWHTRSHSSVKSNFNIKEYPPEVFKIVYFFIDFLQYMACHQVKLVHNKPAHISLH